MWHDMFGWGGWGMGWGWFGLMHVLWWVLLVVGVVALVRWMRDGRSSGDRAQAILRERYARGEIDQAEFDERMRRLNA